MNLSQIVVLGGIVAYFLMKKQLLKSNSKEYVKSIRATLIVPILQVIFFTVFRRIRNEIETIQYARQQPKFPASQIHTIMTRAAKGASKIDSLHNISTYTPYLGDLGTIADIANQNGLLPDIERSQSTLEFISAAGMATNVVSIGILIVIALALAELYGVFNLGKFTKKQMLMLYGGVSATFLICSICLGIWIMKLMTVLSSVISNMNNTEVVVFIAPIIALLLVGIPYMFYSRALKRLYENTEQLTIEK